MNTNLLDLNNDILEIIGEYVKKDNLDRILKEKLKQDILEYVDIEIKIERKGTRKGKYFISRRDTRDLIWVYFVRFCRHRFGFDYLIENNNKYIEITKIYNEYLTKTKLNLKE
jgi:hypothetical protein